MDYKKVLAKAKDGDFVFLDPPYIEEHDYQFNYNKGEKLDESFLLDLLKEVEKLDKNGVRWLMTQANTPQIRKIFKGYIFKKFSVYRGLSNSYNSELLIRNYTK
jgi:DNA adenine methylase